MQIVSSFGLSVLIWLICALPLAITKYSNLAVETAGFIILSLIAALLLKLRKHEKPPSISYTKRQIIGRSIFAGLMISSVVFLGRTLNPFWGGVFAMFPAAFSSALMIIHRYYGATALFPYFEKVAVGSVSIFVYCITVMLVFPEIGFIWGTLIAYLISLAITFLLYKLHLN
jgi:hypothetical protein